MMENLITLEVLSGALASLPREQTLELRSQFIPKACKLHFEKAPMKVIRANGQYLYDDNGTEYLDCVNCVAHVGHCNPSVVEAAKTAMLQMGNVSLGMSDIASEYVTKLKATFPPEIDTFLWVTSGSEANDLAIQLARLYTGGYDVVSVDRGFHGGLSVTNNVSPRQFTNDQKCPDWVHVLQCPDLYRGKYRGDEHNDMDIKNAVEKYCQDAKHVMENAVRNKQKKLACFICEPLITVAGVIIPPSQWIHSVYKDIRSFGGIAIADEAQSGLGRCGASMWCFQMFEDLIPDIITIGKPLGNGHPMACIATRSSIASKLVSSTSNEYACDLVSAAVGLAVLNAVRSFSLQMNARSVGDFLREGIRALAGKHANIGQVRGTGLMIGVEIVYNQESRKPARDIAERICYKMLDHFIILANDGIHKNVLIITPPMCFTCENAHRVVIALDKVLKEIEDNDDGISSVVAAVAQGSTSISGERILSFNELVDFASPGVGIGGGEERTRSSSSNSNDGEVDPSTTVILDSTSTPTYTSLRELTQEEDDGGYVTSNSFASMD